ncbi:MAG: hypothetical protein QOJ50_3992, partial [Cryptosporangiaceae bacterium]|nr:hypothetical protein [Cryptosporangiaceae bacterium]
MSDIAVTPQVTIESTLGGPVSVGAGDPPEPRGYLDATITLPSVIEVAEPGATVYSGISGSCVVTAGASLTSITLFVNDGQGAVFEYGAVIPSGGSGTWTCKPNLYRAGVTAFTVQVTGRWYDEQAKQWVRESFDAVTASCTVKLTSAVPNLFIDGRPPASIEVPSGGLTLQVRAATNPAYGQRQITWAFDGGPEHPTRRDLSDSRGEYWVADVLVPDFPLGAYGLTIRSRQVVGGATAAQRLTFSTVDATAPAVTILHPGPEQVLVMPPTGGLDIVVSGTVLDGQSGVGPAGARWGPGTPSAAYPALTTTDDWANWSSTVRISQTGTYTVDVEAADKAGNRGVATRTFSVVSNYVPASLGERLNHRGYLDALLRFAHDRLIVPPARAADQPTEVTAALLSDLLKQPLARLTQPVAGAADAGDEAVNQLRVTAEILRRAIASGLDPRADPLNKDARLFAQWTFNAGSALVIEGTNFLMDAHHGMGVGFLKPPQLVPGVHDEGLQLGSPDGPSPGGAALSTIALSDKDFTVAFWLNAATLPAGSNAWNYILHQGDNADDQTLLVRMRSDTRALQVSVTTTVAGVSKPFTVESGRAIPPNKWVHVAIARQGTDLRIYVDGVLDVRSTLNGPLTGKSYSLSVGADPWRAGAVAVIDDLRLYVAALAQPEIAALATPPVDRALMTGYLRAAYEALLAGFGTSWPALRLARGDTDEAREALAGRLGIPPHFGSEDTDTLSELTLSASELTGARLQSLFGLRDTATAATDPLVPLAEPLLLTWQRARLRSEWVRQDHAAPPGEANPNRLFPILIDPDLIGQADLAAAPLNGTAAALWQARRSEVDGYFKELDTVYYSDGHAPGQAATFAALIGYAWPDHGIDLAAIAASRAAGTDIGPALAELLLSAAAFEQLLRVSALAGLSAADEADWQDVFAILVQVKKARRYPAWRGEEAQLSLSPSFFALADPPRLRPWLADGTARADWQHVLTMRMRQDAELTAGFRDTVAGADRSTVPLLRDALVAELAGDQPASGFPAVAAWAGERLLIDTTGSGSLVTTRVLQAIESLQALFLLVRTRRLPEDHPAHAWVIQNSDLALFDAEWTWLQRYESWRSAMLTWRYPENTLLPTVVPVTNSEREPFYGANGLVANLRKIPKLTVAKARELGANYVRALPIWPAGQPAPTYLLSDAITPEQMGLRHQSSQTYKTYPILFGIAPMMIAAKLQEAGEYLAALDWYRIVFAYDLPPGQRAIWSTIESEASAVPQLTPVTGWLTHLNPHEIATGTAVDGTTFATARPNPYTRYFLLNLARCHLEFADAQFTQDTPASVAQARELYLTAAAILAEPALDPRPDATREQEFDNPARIALRNRVAAQLAKLRDGRNIAGMLRVIDLPDEGNGDFLLTTPPPSRPPTQYRYRTLAERARQLATLAQQVEAEYLTSLEKYDAGAYRRFEADKALELAKAGVTTR